MRIHIILVGVLWAAGLTACGGSESTGTGGRPDKLGKPTGHIDRQPAETAW